MAFTTFTLDFKGEEMFSGFDKYVAQEKANKKCKMCHGRGYVKIKYPKYNAAVLDYCGCVQNKLNNQQ